MVGHAMVQLARDRGCCADEKPIAHEVAGAGHIDHPRPGSRSRWPALLLALDACFYEQVGAASDQEGQG
jgi:hypothetical protein